MLVGVDHWCRLGGTGIVAWGGAAVSTLVGVDDWWWWGSTAKVA